MLYKAILRLQPLYLRDSTIPFKSFCDNLYLTTVCCNLPNRGSLITRDITNFPFDAL